MSLKAFQLARACCFYWRGLNFQAEGGVGGQRNSIVQT